MRAVRAASVVAALILISAVVMVAILVYRPLPTIHGDTRLIGLRERAEVLRDGYGVPHIFARNAHDLFFLQGYVHAQDRLFQLDLYRRAGQGRLSEVFGQATVDADRLFRTLSLAQAAEKDIALLSAEAREMVEAYAAGVNKYLEQKGETLPLEFILLGYRPEPWRSADSALITKVQGWDQAVNIQTELVRMGAAEKLGAAALATLFPASREVSESDAGAWSRIAGAVRGGGALVGTDVARALLGTSGDAGSNCWAVAPARSASGHALLAGDPHLGVRNPSIWYEVALTGGGFNVVGFSIPGVPGVILGHNDRIAWSLTVAFFDQQDLYLERPDPADPRRFLFRGASEAPEVRRETILVRGRAPVALDVTTTRHGPLVTPVLKGQTAPLALRWTALDGTRNLEAVLALDRARDWPSFREALALFEGPALTLCYADADGHVGWSAAGRVPLRASGDDGRLPLPGWTGEHEWRGALDARDLPWVLDPPDGIAMAANQRQFAYAWPAGSPDEWDGGFRAARILELLRAHERVSVELSRRMQVDVASVPARAFRDLLLAATPRDARATEALRLVREWDGIVGEGSAAAAIYEAWLFRMIERTFRPRLGDELYASYVDRGRPYVALARLVAREDDPWFSDPALAASGRDAIASLALDDAVRDLATRLGGEPRSWRWGALHRITFAHPLGSAVPVLNFGPYELPGDDDTLADAPYDWTRPFTVDNHASLRTIVDFADLDSALSVLPTGQSGQPFDRYWGDQTELWRRGELKPMPLSRERLGPLDGRLILRAR